MSELEEGDMVAGGEHGCPDNYAGCLTPEGAIALQRYFMQLIRYSDLAWIKCQAREENTNAEVTD